MREGMGSVEFVIVGSVVDRFGFDNGDSNPYTSECVRFETKFFAKFICFEIVN